MTLLHHSINFLLILDKLNYEAKVLTYASIINNHLFCTLSLKSFLKLANQLFLTNYTHIILTSKFNIATIKKYIRSRKQ